MHYLRLLLMTFTSIFLIAPSGEKSVLDITKIEAKKIDKKSVAILTFPADDGRWTDVIVNSFKASLHNMKFPVDFTIYTWPYGEDTEPALEKLLSGRPDLIFLPDDVMYLTFAKKIQQRSPSTHILFVAICIDRQETSQVSNQSGVFCDSPLKNLIEQAKKITPIKTVGVVAGPFVNRLWDRIKTDLNALHIDVVLRKTNKWSEYIDTAMDFSKTKDAVWISIPFGVTSDDGASVSNYQMNDLIASLKKITLGYGKVAPYRRSINLNVDPDDLGKNAASIAFKYFRGDNVTVETFTQYSLQISDSNLKKLNLNVPEELLGFVDF